MWSDMVPMQLGTQVLEDLMISILRPGSNTDFYVASWILNSCAAFASRCPRAAQQFWKDSGVVGTWCPARLSGQLCPHAQDPSHSWLPSVAFSFLLRDSSSHQHEWCKTHPVSSSHPTICFPLLKNFQNPVSVVVPECSFFLDELHRHWLSLLSPLRLFAIIRDFSGIESSDLF